MLQPLRLGPVAIDRARYLPPILLPLVQAAARGDDIVPELQTLVRGFGFDSFMYATANYHLRPDNDERMYVFTTLPRDWVIRYDQCAYVECDPRVVASFDNALPLLWDQVSERNRNARTDAFLDDAAAHGVASGVAFPVYATYPSRNIVALNSPAPVIAKERRDELTRMLGEIVLFGQYFHELFVKARDRAGDRPVVGRRAAQQPREALPAARLARAHQRRNRRPPRHRRPHRQLPFREHPEQARRAQPP